MRTLLAAVLLIVVAGPAPASGDRDFDAVVRSVESNFQTRRMRIPLFGVAKFFVKIARPSGVRQLDMAIFEDLQISPSRLQDFDDTVRAAAGERWTPMIRIRERHEWVCIYARPEGKKDMRLLIATIEPDETVLVQVKVRPDVLAQMLDEDPKGTKCLGSDNPCN